MAAIERPVTSHVTRASAQEPLIGHSTVMGRHTTARVEAGSGVSPTADSGQPGDRSAGGRRLVGDLIRLVHLLGKPELPLAPLIKPEIVIRLLAGPHGRQLQHLVAAAGRNERRPDPRRSEDLMDMVDMVDRMMRLAYALPHVFIFIRPRTSGRREISGGGPEGTAQNC